MPGRLPSLLGVLGFGASRCRARANENCDRGRSGGEINFEFNSSILSDGYRSLSRIAERCRRTRATAKVEGHTDWVGSDPFNDKLAVVRANTVKAFLESMEPVPGRLRRAVRASATRKSTITPRKAGL